MIQFNPRRLAALSGLAAIALMLAIPGGGTSAQERLDARTVAALVQSFYDQTQSVQSEFHQTYYLKLYDRYERSRGQVAFKKPGKMRWDYARPNGKVIVSDGQRIQVFEPGEGNDPAQIFEQDLDEHQLPQAFAFLTGTGRLDSDFTFRLLDARRQGFEGGHVLELRPRQPSPHYDRILFYVRIIGEGGRRAGVVQRVLIIDPSGNRNRFDFIDLRFNRPLPDTRFRFQPPAGTRRVRP